MMSGGRWLNKRRRRNYSHPTFSLRLSAENSRRCVRGGGGTAKQGVLLRLNHIAAVDFPSVPPHFIYRWVLLALLLQSKTRENPLFFAFKRNDFHFDFSLVSQAAHSNPTVKNEFSSYLGQNWRL